MINRFVSAPVVHPDLSGVPGQYAAICYRWRSGRVEVLLITSRGSGRWIVPKGWPISGLSPSASAAQEAWEEAGVVGEANDRCLGVYSYRKRKKRAVPIPVMAYAVHVTALRREFPERGQRRRKWVPLKKAASQVRDPELARLLHGFAPAPLH